MGNVQYYEGTLYSRNSFVDWLVFASSNHATEYVANEKRISGIELFSRIFIG